MEQQHLKLYFPDIFDKTWKQKAQDSHWTEEQYTAAWMQVTWEEWENLPQYKKTAMLAEYRASQALAEHRRIVLGRNDNRMDPPNKRSKEAHNDAVLRMLIARQKAWAELIQKHEQ